MPLLDHLPNTKILEEMESHLQHTHGRHYDDDDSLAAVANTGHDHNEDEHHGDKKSVIKKVKEKAKKLKNTITKHGHGHGHGGHDDDHHHLEDDDDEEMTEDPEVHGAPMYDSARVGLGGPDAILAQPRVNLERPSVMAEDRYTTTPNDAPPLVSSTPDVSKPSSQEVKPEKWRAKVGQSTGMDDPLFVPNPATYGLGTKHESNPDVNRGLRSSIEKSTGMVEDPHAPKDLSTAGLDPSNYESKVIDPTHTGGKEAQLSQIQHSFDKMGIKDEPKHYDPNHPENPPRDTITGNPSSRSSSYAEKISSSASAIADKAAVAKNVMASKLGYSSQSPPSSDSGSAADYVHKISDKVTGTLAPVYERVVDAGSSVISKVQGTVTGTEQPQVHGGSESATVEKGTGQPQVHRGLETGKGADKGVSMKEYLVETLRPGDEDKALSEVITHAFHRGNYEESEKKSREDRPVDRVTESAEVRQRLGTDRQEEHPGNVSDKGVADRLKDAVGSWIAGKGNAPQGSLGTSYVTDEGLSSNPAGDGNSGRK